MGTAFGLSPLEDTDTDTLNLATQNALRELASELRHDSHKGEDEDHLRNLIAKVQVQFY